MLRCLVLICLLLALGAPLRAEEQAANPVVSYPGIAGHNSVKKRNSQEAAGAC